MRIVSWFLATMLGLVFSASANAQVTRAPDERLAVAPTGKLRVGMFAVSPIHAKKDPVSGDLKGPAVDLGRELARHIGVPFEAVPYSTIPALLAGATSGEWDVATMGISAERQKVVEFTVPFMIVEYAYLVPGGSSISAPADIDRPNIRIAVAEKGAPDTFLTHTLKQASLIRLPALPQMIEALRAGSADALYGVKAAILEQAEKFNGARIIDDPLGGEQTALALPRGRAGVTYVQRFVEYAKNEGLVRAAIERAALRGVVVAPAK